MFVATVSLIPTGKPVGLSETIRYQAKPEAASDVSEQSHDTVCTFLGATTTSDAKVCALDSCIEAMATRKCFTGGSFTDLKKGASVMLIIQSQTSDMVPVPCSIRRLITVCLLCPNL